MKNFSKASNKIGFFNTVAIVGFYMATGAQVAIDDDGAINTRSVIYR